MGKLLPQDIPMFAKLLNSTLDFSGLQSFVQASTGDNYMTLLSIGIRTDDRAIARRAEPSRNDAGIPCDRLPLSSGGGRTSAPRSPPGPRYPWKPSLGANCPFEPYQLGGRGGPSIRGEKKQAVGRSRGGRNTKIHALADAKGRLIAILLTGGEAHDCPIAERLIRRVPQGKVARANARRQGL
jgi:hypothetical protein